MNTCHDYFGTPENCPELTLQTDEEMNKCSKQTSIDEVTEGECESPPFCVLRSFRCSYARGRPSSSSRMQPHSGWPRPRYHDHRLQRDLHDWCPCCHSCRCRQGHSCALRPIYSRPNQAVCFYVASTNRNRNGEVVQSPCIIMIRIIS